jgi:shikimate dehydrogenase
MVKTDIQRAGVMGWPVSHSVSPRLHGYWLKQYGIAGSYEAMAVMPGDLQSALEKMKNKGFAGVNLTIPHKENALQYMDEIDAIAERTGAVNTVVVKQGKLFGTNTDAYGFMKNLEAQTHGKIFASALVIGAGGAARAICAGLLEAGCHVTVINRTHAKAQAVVEHLKDTRLRAAPWDELPQKMQTAELLINTTPLGMKGQSPLCLPLETLSHTTTVADIVYNPLKTLLLTEAEARGNPIVTGLGMLLYQAQLGFEAWFGLRPEVTDAMHDYVAQGIA